MEKHVFQMEMEPKHLFRSITGFKYQLHEAIGDLADNSVDANCSRIWITVNKSEIIIADNGDGMAIDQLGKAITPWASNEGVREGKRGVYGIGLKSASFSVGLKLEIHTKTKGGEFIFWKTTHEELINKVGKEFRYSPVETDLFRSYKLKYGTIIRITDLNTRKITQPAIDKLKGEIGLMFFRLIEDEKISILINDQKVEALHPLLPDLRKTSNPNYIVKRIGPSEFSTSGDPGNYTKDYKAKIIEVEKANGTFAKIKIHAVHIGRGSHWSNSERNKYRFFLKKNVTPENELENGLLKLDEQGVYLMRNNRLITLGGWLGIHRANTLLHHDVCLRVLIEYDSKDDEVIGVDHTKTKPEILSSLKDAIRDQYLAALLTDSENRFRQEGQILLAKRQIKKASDELQSRPKTMSLWGKKASVNEKIKKNADPELHKKDMELEAEQTKRGKEKTDWFEIVDKLPGKCLWSGQKNKDGHVLVRLAERHPAYSGLYHEFSRDKLRMNLNLFFYFMASFEVDAENLIDGLKPSEKDLINRAFQEFRKYVSVQMSDFGEND